MRFILSLFIVANILSCEPVDRTEGLECQMSSDQLKLILDDVFIYEATKNSKSLDSLSLSYSKSDVYKFIYKKHNTNRLEIQDAIECFTAKKELVPLLKDIEVSYKEWRTNPQFQINESKDSVQ